MSEIIPAILPRSEKDLEGKMAVLPPEVKRFHLDVLETDFWVKSKIDFEVHLMVKEPEKIVQIWIDRGAKRIIAHKQIDTGSVEFGLALKLDDPIEDLGKANFLHLMSRT